MIQLYLMQKITTYCIAVFIVLHRKHKSPINVLTIYFLPRSDPTKIKTGSVPLILLYSQTKGVKQKYILCISGSVAYRQYIHKCNSPQDPYWLTAVSQLSAPPLPWTCLRCGSPLLSLVSAMTHSR